VIRVRVIDEKGFVTEEGEYSGMGGDERAIVQVTEEEASGWYILVGTEDRICYRGDTAAGRVRALDKGYPLAEEDGGQRRMIYRATFQAGSLNARGVNAAVLVRRTGERAQSVAYTRISPVMRIGINDMLRIQWECLALGEVES
jgi:hypothetical protein